MAQNAGAGAIARAPRDRDVGELLVLVPELRALRGAMGVRACDADGDEQTG